VIIPTYQREEVLCETIKQILAQDYPAYELIIVDQTEQHLPSTVEFLQHHASTFHYFNLMNPGVANARNFGMSKARGDILLFLDDDVRIDRDWISRHLKNYRDPSVSGVTGRLIQGGIGSSNIRKVGYVTWSGRIVANFNSLVAADVQLIAGGNCSFRAHLAKSIEGFDSNYAGNALLEDADFSYRFHRQGYRIVYDPDAVVHHLLLSHGGNKTRTQTKGEYYYWFIRNKTYFLLKNLPVHRVIPSVLFAIFRALQVGISDKSLTSFIHVMSGLHDGFNIWNAYKAAMK
jgi:GT2 family glycosyltransferase